MKSIIADAGATKTDWVLAENGKILARVFTLGINPFHEDEAAITRIVTEELLPNLPKEAEGADIHFYGAGCTPEKCISMEAILHKLFPKSQHVTVLSDLWGAAHALCLHEAGIACILGTGSNSCYYDGKQIVLNTPPLGYILGDEGSGAVLGKLFVADVLKGIMPQDLAKQFLSESNLTKEDILNHVYRGELPSRFLASVVPFISKMRHVQEVHYLAIRNFRNFFSRNLKPYGHSDLPVNFIGGFAYGWSDELHEAAELEGFHIGDIEKSPIDGLVEFHSK